MDGQNHYSILHYTGSIDTKNLTFFRKNNYFRCSPFFDDFSFFDTNSASSLLVEEIKKYNQSQLKNRIDLSDVSFLIPVRIDSEERWENLKIVINYLHLHFKTNIIILEIDYEQKVDFTSLSKDIIYHFIKDGNSLFDETNYTNQLTSLIDTQIIALYDNDVILPFSQIVESVDKLRKQIAEIVYPYSENLMEIDLLMKTMFSKLLDIDILEKNQGKHISKKHYCNCLLLNKKSFIEAGGQYKNLINEPFCNIQFKERQELLGNRIMHVKGNAYHFPTFKQIMLTLITIRRYSSYTKNLI